MIRWTIKCVKWLNAVMAGCPALSLAVRTILFAIFVHWCIEWIKSLSKCSGFKTREYTYPANTLPPMFPSGSVVLDIPNGSLSTLQYVISNEPVSMVLYYAPWCYVSRKTARHFEQAAQTLKGEVTFIAINCRAVDGDCRTTHNNIIFPTVTGNFAYGYIMINYLRPFSHAYLTQFGRKLVRPLHYLATHEQFVDQIEVEELMVIANFDFASTRRPPGFQKYHQIAMRDLESELQYGIVTNPTVATAIGLPNAPSIVMYSTTHGIHQYIGTFDRAKFRNWTSTHYHYRVVNKLQWNGVLGGSFAILFVPLNHTELTIPTLREYKSAATRYQAVLHSSKVSCYNLKHFKHSACMPSIPQSLSSQYDDYYCSVFPEEQYYSRMECQSSLHDSVLMLPYSCMLKCYPLNMTFLYADSFILLSLMRKMGLEDSHKPSLMIVDTKSEMQFAMDSTMEFNSDNIFQFLLNVSKGLAMPFYKTTAPPTNPVVYTNSMFNVSVIELVGSTFTSTVMDPTKDVLVAHYSKWCSHCLTFWPLYYSLAYSYHSVVDLLFTRIDSDRNDLLPCHQVKEFPSVVLYLKNRKSSPVIIPKESLANLDTLMSSVGNSIGNAPSSNERRKNEEMMIHQKEEWSHHGWYLWKRVEKERQRLEEENRKLARSVQELQHRLDETTEGQKPLLTDFTTLANELQKMLGLEVFSTVTSDRDKSNVLTEAVSDNNVCTEDRNKNIFDFNKKKLSR